MKWIVSLLFCAFATPSFAKNLIVAGDSWAWLMCLNQSFQTAFWKAKVPANVPLCSWTTGPGIRAEAWFRKPESRQLQRVLKFNQASAIYLSLGGNDFLASWNKSMGPVQETALFARIRQDVQAVVDSIHAVAPGVKVLVSGYDYGRFGSENQKISTYKKIFQRMGSPSNLEMHLGILRFAAEMARINNGKDTFYIHHHGVTQYHFGNRDAGLESYQSLPPEQISPPENPMAFGGFPELELDRKAMIRLGSRWVDSYHLTTTGFFFIADHATYHYLRHWLK